MNKIEQSGLGNSYYAIFHGGQEPKSRKSKKPDISEKQISIGELQDNSIKKKEQRLLKSEDEILGNLEPKKRKITILPVDETRLNPTDPIKIDFSVIYAIRKKMELLREKNIVELNIEEMTNEELLSKLVLFKSETEFHNLHVAKGVFKGGILALPIKTTNLYDATTGEYLYVSNYSINNNKRVNRSSTNYCIAGTNKPFKTMKNGETFSIKNGEAIKIIGHNYYDRSLIRSR